MIYLAYRSGKEPEAFIFNLTTELLISLNDISYADKNLVKSHQGYRDENVLLREKRCTLLLYLFIVKISEPATLKQLMLLGQCYRL